MGLAANLQLMGAIPSCTYCKYPFDPPGWVDEGRDAMPTKPIRMDADGYVRMSRRARRDFLYNSFMFGIRRKRCSEPVFTGEALEAELVANMLRAEGFSVLVQSTPSRPYFGTVGVSRVMVPCDNREAAVAFLDSLHEEDKEKT